MTFEELQQKFAEFGEGNPDGEAKAKLIVNLLESLHLRTGLLIDRVDSDQIDRVLLEYVKVLSGAVNMVGDLLTRPIDE